jgi:hypothetical protein
VLTIYKYAHTRAHTCIHTHTETHIQTKVGISFSHHFIGVGKLEEGVDGTPAAGTLLRREKRHAATAHGDVAARQQDDVLGRRVADCAFRIIVFQPVDGQDLRQGLRWRGYW